MKKLSEILSESPNQSIANKKKMKFDMARVNAGAMSRDEYSKKWKVGKYKPAGNKLAGPGGVYKNLIKDEEESDVVGEALSMLDQISEMTEELYDTLSDLDTLEESVISEINSIYSHVDDFYTDIDEKYGIDSDDDDDYDFSDMQEELDTVNEAIDYTKFKRLASTGLVDSAEISKLILAMKSLEADKAITAAQKDIISNTFLSLIAVVTGDSAILAKITQELK
jgi:vacuolar-type H+-ATPase subunit I/STV1